MGTNTAKPWDSLRIEPKVPPIRSGRWRTTKRTATVDVAVNDQVVTLSTGSLDSLRNQVFAATDLRELAEFCNELADQLEGK